MNFGPLVLLIETGVKVGRTMAAIFEFGLMLPAIGMDLRGADSSRRQAVKAVIVNPNAMNLVIGTFMESSSLLASLVRPSVVTHEPDRAGVT
jgi:hypothetical protein